MKQQIVLAAGLALSSLMAPLAQAATTLTVYTALEADQVKEYKEAFEKANPDIEIRFVRESTGIITAKLLSEKQSAGRRGVGPGRHQSDDPGPAGHAAAVRAQGRGKAEPGLRGQRQAAQVDRHGRVGGHHLFQHRGSGQEEPAQARELGGSDQAGL